MLGFQTTNLMFSDVVWTVEYGHFALVNSAYGLLRLRVLVL